ncbi:MAG: methionine--tRNA ligase subunit beta, partial [Flavobacteriales bacterium]|nr:methionine--tRNA ligase subunit beta [Flavobacteriales bacterium]
AMLGARLGNKYLAETEPWKLIKNDEEQVKGVMFQSLRLVEHLSRVLASFLPNTALRLRIMLGLEEDEKLTHGRPLGKVEHLFQRVTDEEIEEQKIKLRKEEKSKKIRKEMITFEDFTKLDIVVGRIVSAEKVEGTDKLLQLSVDLGDETRTIVSGIAEHYDPEVLIDTQVSVLVNLSPRKIKGVESQGMILMAEDEQGKLSFVNPDKQTSLGARIR